MDKLSNIGTIRDILNRHGFSFSKALGQNFLINPSVCPRMAENAVQTQETGVIEIGPGIGVLTAELAKRAKKVSAIELDERLLPVLSETLSEFDNVTVINADALKIDMRKLIEEHFADCKEVTVCANLPYYVTSPIIMKLLEDKLPIKSITVMVQKEAAVRLCAEIGTREAGAITVGVRYYSTPKMLFAVSRGSFMPAPNVDSAVISLSIAPRPAFEVGDEAVFFSLVKAAFSQRRKTLLNSLTATGFLSKEDVRRLLIESNIPLNARIEQLTAEQLGTLSQAASGSKASGGE
ncbi:MAG: 16S rRNA (adenine(1518)-N(6)/adenine(1519)-N(6))-dimethyltransferase RsmA [Oscillospiraceae bacterium]|jgi:16S rRNA (adenine1518-N6/adenine1519-N6)-dimethyltransferase|nr:16S rRNA (adenine(1518)-N(6)/adenine(1519)-N(6))-dimethyltransferase RsmA [Oscillospiraceae bacterium]